jgi:hypothetical protein
VRKRWEHTRRGCSIEGSGKQKSSRTHLGPALKTRGSSRMPTAVPLTRTRGGEQTVKGCAESCAKQSRAEHDFDRERRGNSVSAEHDDDGRRLGQHVRRPSRVCVAAVLVARVKLAAGWSRWVGARVTTGGDQRSEGFGSGSASRQKRRDGSSAQRTETCSQRCEGAPRSIRLKRATG